MASLQPAERTKEDREYYDAVLAFMKTNHLSENCTGAQYMDKAMAFIIHVFKHVARPYTNDLAGEELVGFMPLCLSSDSRRLLAEFRADKDRQEGSGRKSQIPGYRGYIRGSQHYYGATYGHLTRGAKAHDFKSGGVTQGLPPKNPRCDDVDHLPGNRLPGYAGHVTGAKYEFANTYGVATTKLISGYKE